MPLKIPNQIICSYAAGCSSHGLNSCSSDHNVRGLYRTTELSSVIDPYSYTDAHMSVVGLGTNTVYYEIRHFFHLLYQADPAAVEMLYNDCWIEKNDYYIKIQANRKHLLSPAKLNSRICSYALHEYAQATCDKTNKHQDLIARYGFVPKTFANLLRTLYCAETFYTSGVYPVNVRDSYIYPQLVEVRQHPERFSLERFDEMIQERLHSHDQTWNNYRDSSIMQSYQFDRGLAARLMLAGYIDMLVAESDLNIFKKTSHKLAQLMFDK